MIYLYLRVSTDRQESEGQGLQAQEALGRHIFSSQKFEIVKEVGSGRKECVEDRPILSGTLESLKEGDRIWFYDEDRMARDNGVKKQILKILRKKRANLQIRHEEIDIYDPQAILRLGLKGEFDEYMGAWLVQRMKAGRDIAVLQKKRWYGGITPFGYTKKKTNPEDPEYHNLLVDIEEAKIYKQMVKWCIEGLGTGKIARRLNELGIKTNFSSKGRKNQNFVWKQQVVLRILKNRIYKGEFHYKGKTIAVTPIISEKEWNSIQERLQKNSISSPRNTKRFYLLRSLLKCGNCGRNLFGYIKENRGERVYKCISKRPDPAPRSCGLRSINIDKANHDVWSKVREYILSLEKLKTAIRNQKDTSFIDQLELETQINLIRKKIIEKDQEISDLLRKKGRFSNISDNEIEQIIGEIKREKNELIIYENQILERIQNLQSVESRTNEIEKFLSNFSNRVDQLNDNEKYDILHTIVNKITVTYDSNLRKHHTNVSLSLNPEVPTSALKREYINL